MINLDKCSGSYNLLSPTICGLKKKVINVKAFNMIKNKMKLNFKTFVFKIVRVIILMT